MKSKIIAVDFDGTCVKHRYPYVGEDIGAVPILKKLVENGHKIILLTMRDSGTVLRDALGWFRKNEIPLYAVNQIHLKIAGLIVEKYLLIIILMIRPLVFL